MPTQKDFKRLVRARMRKTGESYTTARLRLLEKNNGPASAARRGSPEPTPREAAARAKAEYAELAGMSDAVISKRTGRTWAEWVRALDAERAAEKPHREIAKYVSSLGVPDWWTQTITVGYERIRGLRARGQQRDGGYQATKSRTFNVPIATLYHSFAHARTRQRWLPVTVAVRTAQPNRTMRINWDDDTRVAIGFMSKGAGKSAVAVQHERLRDKAAADAMKQAWSDHFDRLAQLLQRGSSASSAVAFSQ
jgi:uncharacterized protein YndB with AHSA1/START domain